MGALSEEPALSPIRAVRLSIDIYTEDFSGTSWHNNRWAKEGHEEFAVLPSGTESWP